MNKHSKHRPLMDALEMAIARNECSPQDMYQNMMEVCDQDEKEIAELKAENERLKNLIGMCDKDMYSASGRISKKTAIELMKHAGRFS